MNNFHAKRHKTNASQAVPNKNAKDGAPLDLINVAKRQKNFELFSIGILLAFGIGISMTYFGFKVIPTPDNFIQTGHELLAFQKPSSFKRAPVVGLLQAGLSHVVGGQTPDLTAGRLVNAVLYPFIGVLLWLIGKRFIGSSAVWFSAIIMINPWVINYMTDPIAETTLMFFILLTMYFILKRSNWGYFLASITTMVRYEGAALILAAFVMDMIYAKDRRQRIKAFLYSALAVVPLAIWLFGTLTSSNENYIELFSKKSDYAKNMSQSFEEVTGFGRNLELLWQIGFGSLLMPPPTSSNEDVQIISNLNKILTAITFCFGSIYCVYKRHWKILPFLILLIPYYLIHAKFPAPLLRYYAPVFWVMVLISVFGLVTFYNVTKLKLQVPKWVIYFLQIFLFAVALVFFIPLTEYLPDLSRFSPKSSIVLWMALGLLIIVLAGRILIYKKKNFVKELSILMVLGLVVISNQFTLAQVLNDGKTQDEFKYLADWYLANAKPDEKMALYMMGTVQLYTPRQQDNILRLPVAKDPNEFVKACHENGIKYVVWASREGLSKDHPGYRMNNYHVTIAMLRDTRDIGPYKFVTQIKGARGYVNVFRLD